MKLPSALVALAIPWMAVAQESVPVRLAPNPEAPQIGQLESASLATPTEWPDTIEPHQGWQPIYYRGVFEVYSDNNDIGKDLIPKPGSPYYLRPDRGSPKLTVATATDKVDIISVDTEFCKMRLETIVLAYISTSPPEPAAETAQAQPEVAPTPTPARAENVPPPSESETVRHLAGKVEKLSLLMRNRIGLAYKLTATDGATLAFLDLSQLPGRLQIDDFLDESVRASGVLQPTNGSATLTLVVQSLNSSDL